MTRQHLYCVDCRQDNEVEVVKGKITKCYRACFCCVVQMFADDNKPLTKMTFNVSPAACKTKEEQQTIFAKVRLWINDNIKQPLVKVIR